MTWRPQPLVDAVVALPVPGAWLGAGLPFVLAIVLGIITARFCADRWTALVAVAVALMTVGEAVWLPKGVNILLPAFVVWMLLPKRILAKVPARLRNTLPAAFVAAITAGIAMFGPPPGLRAAVLLSAGAAALAASAWRHVAPATHLLRK